MVTSSGGWEGVSTPVYSYMSCNMEENSVLSGNGDGRFSCFNNMVIGSEVQFT